MSSTSPDFALNLSADTGCELFIIDSRMRLVQRGVGNLNARLPAGVYKVKVRRGREENEQIILLDRDQTIPLGAPSVASPAPFEGTARDGTSGTSTRPNGRAATSTSWPAP